MDTEDWGHGRLSVRYGLLCATMLVATMSN